MASPAPMFMVKPQLDIGDFFILGAGHSLKPRTGHCLNYFSLHGIFIVDIDPKTSPKCRQKYLVGGFSWNLTFIFPLILGMSSSQLKSFIFFRGVGWKTTNQIPAAPIRWSNRQVFYYMDKIPPKKAPDYAYKALDSVQATGTCRMSFFLWASEGGFCWVH